MKYPLDFYTQYGQFYICDKDSENDTGKDSFWTSDAFNDRLAIGTGVLGIGTECYGPVKGELEILDFSRTITDLDEYDHVVEGDLEINSGVIQILDCPNSIVELELTVPPGNYRVRIYSSNLASVEGDEGDDFYKIEIWRGLSTERKVFKRYNRPGANYKNN
jgi:hypothetical protein